MGGQAESPPRLGPELRTSLPQEMPGQDLRSREEAARTKQLVMAALQEAAATQDNVTWRKNWLSGGGGKSA